MKLNFLPDTEMGNLIRNYDWSKTSLGDINTWSEGLLTALSITMNSRFPMFLFWGKDLISFYNDAYRPSFGDNGMHPAILGKPAEEAWADIWHIVKKFPEQVLSTGIATWEENQLIPIYRNGKNEDVYWTFSHSPIYNTAGIIEGIFVVCMDTTREVIATKKIKESENRYRQLIQAAPIAIGLFVGRDLVIENPNQEFIDIVGKGSDIAGRRLVDVMPELVEHGQPYLRILDDVFTSGKTYQSYGDPVNIVRNGVMHHGFYDIYYVPIFDTAGNVYAILDIAIDVTEIVLTRKKIEENEQRFRLSLAGTNQTFFSQDKNLRYTWIHNAHDNFKAADVVGKTDEELLEKSSAAILTTLKREILATGKAFNGDVEFKIVGQSTNYTMHLEPIKDADENVVGIIGTAMDITERVKSEQKIKESEQKFRLLADSMPQFIWTSNEKGELNYFNSTVYNYSGLSEEEVERDGWLQIVHPEEREENIRQWMHSIETGETFHFEHRFRRFDGEYKWQLSRAIPQRDSEGRIQMWVGTSTEIQQQKEIREQLEKSVVKRTQELLAVNDTLEEKNRELEKMNKELESFTYISSHDLQEPLRKIQTMSSRILQKEKQNLTETGKDYFQRMQNAASRMQSLIDDLLAFSRTNTAERKFELTDLKIIVQEVENELKEQINENHAVIETHVLCEVNIIPFQFRQLLHNLISNAIKFTKSGSTPHVLIDSRKVSFSDSEKNEAGLPPQMLLAKKEYCHITVKDNGIGFDPQYSERIFEVFQRLHGKSEFEGTGIGLAIVKKIVENHKGFIVAKGEVGKGATFNIYIPVT